MVLECYECRIERPKGLCGYRPSYWCTVCGRKASPTTDQQCTTEACPNLCHVHCLGDATEYRCGDTGQLRALAGITDPVTFFVENSQEPTASLPSSSLPPTPSADLVEEQQEDGLDNLTKEELIQQLRKVRSELATTKGQLTNYRAITAGLAEKRCVLVEAISIVDTILATHASEDLQQRSVACSARPHKILSEVVSTVSADTPENTSLSPPPTNTPRSSSPDPAPEAAEGQGQGGSPPKRPPPPSSHHSSLESAEERGEALSFTPLPSSHHPALVSSEGRGQALSVALPTSFSQPGQPTPPTGGIRRETRTSGNSSTEDRQTGGHQRPLKRKKRPATRQNALSEREAAPLPRQGLEQHYQSRRPQSSSPRHTPEQRHKKVCEYCRGRFHSALDCRARAADERQQELVQAVKQSGQETLLALRNVAWQLQQPASRQRLAEPRPVTPIVPPASRFPWPLAPHPYGFQYGAAPQYYPAMSQAAQ